MFKQRQILEAKREELEARLAMLRADEDSSADEIRDVREQLADLGAALKHGYDRLTERAARRIDEILDARSSDARI